MLLNLPIPIKGQHYFWAKSAIFWNPFLIVIWKAGLCLPNQPLENGTNVSLSRNQSDKMMMMMTMWVVMMMMVMIVVMSRMVRIRIAITMMNSNLPANQGGK